MRVGGAAKRAEARLEWHGNRELYFMCSGTGPGHEYEAAGRFPVTSVCA